MSLNGLDAAAVAEAHQAAQADAGGWYVPLSHIVLFLGCACRRKKLTEVDLGSC